MADIIGIDGKAVEAPERTYDYEFTLKPDTKVIEHGLLQFNPVFAGTIDAEGKVLFATPMDNVLTIRRLEPRPALNS